MRNAVVEFVVCAAAGAVAATVAWLAVCFIGWSTDPSGWGAEYRALAVIITGSAAAMAGMAAQGWLPKRRDP